MPVDESTFEFELKRPVEIHSGGALAQIKSLTLTAPSTANRAQTTVLKSIFYQAMTLQMKSRPATDKAGEPAQDTDTDIKPTEIMAIVYMADVDHERFEQAFRTLLLAPGICDVAGQRLTPVILDKISDEDMDGLVGTYLANFTLGSSLRALNQ